MGFFYLYGITIKFRTMIDVVRKFFIRELNKVFYPGETVKLKEEHEKRAVNAGAAKKSKATKEKTLPINDGERAEAERVKQASLENRKKEAQAKKVSTRSASPKKAPAKKSPPKKSPPKKAPAKKES